MQPRFDPWVGRDPGEGMAPHSRSCLESPKRFIGKETGGLQSRYGVSRDWRLLHAHAMQTR